MAKTKYSITIINTQAVPKDVEYDHDSIIEVLKLIVAEYGNVLIRNIAFKGDRLLNSILVPVATYLISSSSIPATVTGLAEVSTTSTTIIFTHDLMTDALFYEYDLDDADGIQYAPEALDITIGSLTTITEYTYRVRAGNAAGMSAWSSGVASTTD